MKMEGIMYALFLVLNDIYLLDEVHEIFYKHKLGATTLDSAGLGKTLFEHNVNVIVFSSIKRIIEGDRPYSKTIISVVREKEKLDAVILDLKDFLGSFGSSGIGFMFIAPVKDVYTISDNTKREYT